RPAGAGWSGGRWRWRRARGRRAARRSARAWGCRGEGPSHCTMALTGVSGGRPLRTTSASAALGGAAAGRQAQLLDLRGLGLRADGMAEQEADVAGLRDADLEHGAALQMRLLEPPVEHAEQRGAAPHLDRAPLVRAAAPVAAQLDLRTGHGAHDRELVDAEG